MGAFHFLFSYSCFELKQELNRTIWLCSIASSPRYQRGRNAYILIRTEGGGCIPCLIFLVRLNPISYSAMRLSRERIVGPGRINVILAFFPCGGYYAIITSLGAGWTRKERIGPGTSGRKRQGEKLGAGWGCYLYIVFCLFAVVLVSRPPSHTSQAGAIPPTLRNFFYLLKCYL